MHKKENISYIATLLFTLTALTSMVIYNISSFYSNAVSNMDKMCESSLAKEKEYLEEYLAKGLDVLQVTVITIEYMMQKGASSSEIEAFLVEQSERYMADIDENFTGIYGLVNGEYIDGIGWVPEEDYVPKEREWYIAAKKASGKPTIVSPYLDAQTNTIMISVSQMLYDNDSVISIDIVLNQIQIITQDINIDGMGYGFIIDREGLVVAHSDESEKGKNYVKDAEMKKLLGKIYNEKEKKFRTKIYDEECTVFVDTVMDDWFVTMIISNSKLYHDIRTILTYNIILCVVVFALTSFFCTVAFRKIRMHIKKVEESQRKLENMNEKMVTTIARTIDARDRYTNGHSQRVAKYAMELARRMGKTENEQKEIYYAALLHDVGKIHVPDAIIHKPSKLSEEEFAHIRLHPISGYYILKDIDEMDMIARGSRWHHERYDGNGYPNGLAGEGIPEVARIIGVADAYDAMTSNRSYRQIMPQEKVREEIENGKGTQFDPQIADIMLEMIDEDVLYQMKQKCDTTKNILIADGDSQATDIIEHILQNETEYIVHKSSSGKEALQILMKTPVELVLLDIRLPDTDGFELCREIQKTWQIPIVFMIEDKNFDTIERAAAMGIKDYLSKPVTPLTLLEVIRSIL
ncbi:MAG: HD domain-containing protein [Lachnospiraceae bacterium]